MKWSWARGYTLVALLPAALVLDYYDPAWWWAVVVGVGAAILAIIWDGWVLGKSYDDMDDLL